MKKRNNVITLPLEGMTGHGCAEIVDRTLTELPGIYDLAVSMADNEVNLSYDPELIFIDEIISTIQSIGYNVPQGEITLIVEGMKCITCVIHVEGVLSDLEGVRNATVNLSQGTTAVQYIPLLVSPDEMIEAIQMMGYHAVIQ